MQETARTVTRERGDPGAGVDGVKQGQHVQDRAFRAKVHTLPRMLIVTFGVFMLTNSILALLDFIIDNI